MIVAAIPSRWLATRIGSDARAHHWNVLASSAVITGLLASGGATRLPGVCLCRWLFGVPCPFCGATHAATAALQGDLAGAFALHPVGAAAALVLAMQVPWRVLRLADGVPMSPRAGARPQRAWHALLVATAMIDWIVRL